ncbi:hypothetical protein RHMOL_Rhmol05G0050900 [Rhododendron molle]|uniref:Uncharacterized protein n=1 Tax=Rhododendron molle TaxID=49168 RepID=A0ACC0NM57_RHOML|nr:hypothetical protein RHMOL_Rhmol05G0050900 [Rhododendron molle]
MKLLNILGYIAVTTVKSVRTSKSNSALRLRFIRGPTPEEESLTTNTKESLGSLRLAMYNFDLRLVVPVFLNLALCLVQQHEGKPWLPSLPNLNLNWKIWFFSFVILTVVLITSVTLPLSVTAERIRVQIGDFSFFLAITLLGSVFLPQPLFWFWYIIILCISPWHGFLSGLLVLFLFSIWNILRSIPVLIIACVVQKHQQDERETDPPPPPHQALVVADDIEIAGNPILPEQPPSPIQVVVVDDDIEIGGNPILPEQPPSEPNTAVVS